MQSREGLVVKPGKRPRYPLGEHLAQHGPKTALTKEEREWLDSQPVGRELIWIKPARLTSGRAMEGRSKAFLV